MRQIRNILLYALICTFSLSAFAQPKGFDLLLPGESLESDFFNELENHWGSPFTLANNETSQEIEIENVQDASLNIIIVASNGNQFTITRAEFEILLSNLHPDLAEVLRGQWGKSKTGETAVLETELSSQALYLLLHYVVRGHAMSEELQRMLKSSLKHLQNLKKEADKFISSKKYHALLNDVLPQWKQDSIANTVYFDDLENIIREAEFSPETAFEKAEGVTVRSGRFKSGTKGSRQYPDGILEITIDAEKAKDRSLFQFSNSKHYPFLKKSCLLNLKFKGAFPSKQISLPNMHTVIEGTDFDDAKFWIAKEEDAAKKNFYFKDLQNAPVNIQAFGKVYAANPQAFTLIPGSSTRHIGSLHKNKRTQFIAEHTTFDNKIDYTDDHRRPARPNQIEQLVDLLWAKEEKPNEPLWATIVGATGTGKSYTMQRHAELSEGRKTIILTSRSNLVSDHSSSFRRDFPNLNVTNSDETNENLETFLKNRLADPNVDVIVTTMQGFQMLYENKGNLDFLKIGNIIVMCDEAHNFRSKKRSKLIGYLKSFTNIDILLFTATPDFYEPHQETSISSVYELSEEKKANPKVKAFKTKPAIDAKILAPFQIVFVKGLQLKINKLSGGEFIQKELDDQLADSVENMSAVLDIYANADFTNPQNENDSIRGKYAMAFCSGIAHAEALTAFLNSFGLKVDAHETLYRANIDKVFSNVESAEFKAIQKALGKWNIQKLKEEFLVKYPYKFADAVHSGSKTHPANKSDMDMRLLQNKLGGSTILCGADKLTEGFDNPMIEVGFILNPVRSSNTKSEQRFGRLLRIDPANPNKVAIAFEFVWDNRQLLLSQIQDNVMHYGSKDKVPLTMSVPEHIPDAPQYILSTEFILEGKLPKSLKRKLEKVPSPLTQSSEQKKRKLRSPGDEALVKEFQDKLKQLQDVSEEFKKFKVLEDEEEEAREFTTTSTTSTNSVQSMLVESATTAMEDLDFDELHLDRGVFINIQEILSNLKTSLKRKSQKTHMEVESKAKNANPHIATTNRDHLRKLLGSMSRQIDAAKRFMTNAQVQTAIRQPYSITETTIPENPEKLSYPTPQIQTQPENTQSISMISGILQPIQGLPGKTAEMPPQSASQLYLQSLVGAPRQSPNNSSPFSQARFLISQARFLNAKASEPPLEAFDELLSNHPEILYQKGADDLTLLEVSAICKNPAAAILMIAHGAHPYLRVQGLGECIEDLTMKLAQLMTRNPNSYQCFKLISGYVARAHHDIEVRRILFELVLYRWARTIQWQGTLKDLAEREYYWFESSALEARFADEQKRWSRPATHQSISKTTTTTTINSGFESSNWNTQPPLNAIQTQPQINVALPSNADTNPFQEALFALQYRNLSGLHVLLKKYPNIVFQQGSDNLTLLETARRDYFYDAAVLLIAHGAKPHLGPRAVTTSFDVLHIEKLVRQAENFFEQNHSWVQFLERVVMRFAEEASDKGTLVKIVLGLWAKALNWKGSLRDFSNRMYPLLEVSIETKDERYFADEQKGWTQPATAQSSSTTTKMTNPRFLDATITVAHGPQYWMSFLSQLRVLTTSGLTHLTIKFTGFEGNANLVQDMLDHLKSLIFPASLTELVFRVSEIPGDLVYSVSEHTTTIYKTVDDLSQSPFMRSEVTTDSLGRRRMLWAAKDSSGKIVAVKITKGQ